MTKPKTIFVDIDGTIFKHKGSLVKTLLEESCLLDGVAERFDEWKGKNYCIIITTARPESMREKTAKELQKSGLFYDKLIMGITSGERIVINDVKPGNLRSANCFNVPRNEGLKGVLL